MTKQLAYPHTVRDILQEYEAKAQNLKSNLSELEQAIQKMNRDVDVWACNPHGALVSVYLSEADAAKRIKASTWNAIYIALNLDKVFSASDKKKFESMLGSPLDITPENLQDIFGRFWENPRFYVLKGLAEVFTKLDPFYKSHSNFGVGVKGLPKRIILNGFGAWYSGGADQLKDICAAMLQVKPDAWLGEFVPEAERKTYQQIINDNTSSIYAKIEPFKIEQLGLEIKRFRNGNAHIHFNPRALNLVNDALHEFYGAVIPDEVEKPTSKQKTSEVSKDLAFYPTPPAVVKRVMNKLSAFANKSGLILEPSCGDGAFLDALRDEGYKSMGVEVDYSRAEICKQKGHNVVCGNFLTFESFRQFDAVVMNPPFAGFHYQKHLEKAIELLKEGGYLIAILPANAWYSHNSDLLFCGRWEDLPVASFKDSGTNVGTGIWIFKK